MPDGPRTSARLDPAVSWTVLTDAPLLGLSHAREAGLLLAWDDGAHVYLVDGGGDRRYESRAPEKIVSAAISDDGTLVALLLAKSRLLLLGPELEPIDERAAPAEATNLAVDPHGRFVAVGTKTSETALFTRYGKPSVKFETRQPLAHLVFVPGLPMLVGASTFGLLVGIELSEVRLSAGLDAEVLWEEKLGTGIGRLTCSGDGGLILASCFTHGVQRYDLRGQNEGSYHLGGTASHAVPDFAGRRRPADPVGDVAGRTPSCVGGRIDGISTQRLGPALPGPQRQVVPRRRHRERTQRLRDVRGDRQRLPG